MAERNEMDGGDAIMRAFRDLRLDYCMSSPGSEWGPLWEAFARQSVANEKGPTYLSCAHETLAVNLALGYTAYTGRMQAVTLHAGVGLLQGAMAIEAAKRMCLPMLILSGEARTYGEEEGVDPGPQWQSMLSVAGGMHSLLAPITKLSHQASSTATLHQQLVNSGEIAQRAPCGPVYVNVPIQAMRLPWTPPDFPRTVPPRSVLVPAAAEVESVADILVQAERPVIMCEEVGKKPGAFEALTGLAEALAIPVVDGPASHYANFPTDHPLHQGCGRPDFLFDADVVLTVACKAPWYPPTNRPADATLIAVDETPFRPIMAYPANMADRFLEGDLTATLTLLTEAVKAARPDAAKVEARRGRWSKAHDGMMADRQAAHEAALAADAISPVGALAALGRAAPEDAIYVEEMITHRLAGLTHLPKRRPQSQYRAEGGLGQGLGMSLGVKVAARDRTVVTAIGDGSFMYNPVVQSLAFAQAEELPHLILIMNNSGYEAMKQDHLSYYPDGVAQTNDLFVGRPIQEFEYAELAPLFGGVGYTARTPGELQHALDEGFKAVADGKLAIVNAHLTA